MAVFPNEIRLIHSESVCLCLSFYLRFTAMASVLFVSDCFPFMSVRLQLHLSPRVREEGPVGLQPER